MLTKYRWFGEIYAPFLQIADKFVTHLQSGKIGLNFFDSKFSNRWKCIKIVDQKKIYYKNNFDVYGTVNNASDCLVSIFISDGVSIVL